jgi:hypothetical protein
MVGIAATASLWIQDMDYDQYRPARPFDTLLVPIHVLFQSLWFNSSPVTNYGLCGKKKQTTAKHWWALQQPPLFEFRTCIMINSDQLHHLTHCWYPYMCFSSHFDSIPHQWQMMASVRNRNKQQQNSGGHCRNRLFVNTRHGLWSIQTS